MYDPSWPHGHTYFGKPCRVLATDLARPCDDYSIAIALMLDDGITETAIQVRHDELMPVPAPKRRIRGWIIINRDKSVSPYFGDIIFQTKEHALASVGDRAKAIVYIDAEEGEGLEQQTRNDGCSGTVSLVRGLGDAGVANSGVALLRKPVAGVASGPLR